MNRFQWVLSAGVAVLFSAAFMGHAQAATLSLSPSSLETRDSCKVLVDILIDTEGVASNAADVFLRYNPAEIDLIDRDEALEGVQIQPGEVYETYANLEVDTKKGMIRTTAFTTGDEGYTTSGEADVFASFVFQNKPGVSETTISFEYARGATVDSNIANFSNKDVLSGVQNGTYTFSDTECVTDLEPPRVALVTPSEGTAGVTAESQFRVILEDNDAGVDLSSVRIHLAGKDYHSKSDAVSTDGTPKRMIFDLSPEEIPSQQPQFITVRAADREGNEMPEFVSGFNYSDVPSGDVVCGDNRVQGAEQCEPPGRGGCSDACQVIPFSFLWLWSMPQVWGVGLLLLVLIVILAMKCSQKKGKKRK